MSEILSVLIGSAGGGTVVGALVLALIKRNLDRDREERKKLSDRVETLENDKVKRLELDIKQVALECRNHIEKDRTQEVLARLDTLVSAVNKLSDATSRALEANAGQTATIEQHERHLNNLDHMLNRHITMHMGGK